MTFKYKTLSWACVSYVLGCSAFQAQAQTPSSISTTANDTVVVSGSRSAAKLSETAAAIGLVTRKQWDEEMPKTIGEIINRIPGVFWNDLGNEQHSMSIRQPISTGAVYQYLEDGIPIRPLGVFNHNALNENNMNAAAGIEVVKGAASSLYGSNAVGGAVNFLSQRSSKTPTGYLGVRYDDVDGFTRVDSGASNTWGDLGLRFSHYSSHRQSQNWQEYSGGRKDSFSLRADYNLSATSWMRASLIKTDLDTETPGSLFETDYRNSVGKSLNTFTWRKDITTRANVAWEGETTAGGVTTVTAFTRQNDHGQLPNYTITGCAGTTCRGTLNNNHVESLGVDVKHDQKLNGNKAKLVTGLTIDRSQNVFVSDNLAITRDTATGRYLSYTLNSVKNPTGVRNYSADIVNHAAFAQFEFLPIDKLRIVAGGRYDSISYDFKNNLTPGANYGAANEIRGFNRLTPKLGGTYALDSRNSFYGNLSQGFTPPEVSQLYGKSAVPDLKPAIYDNTELGWRAALLDGSVKLDSAIYRLDGKDTIVSYTPAVGDSSNQNAGQTRSEGLEIALSQEGKKMDWRLGATWAQHTYIHYRVSDKLGAIEDYSGKAIKQAPAHAVNASVAYKLAPGARVALSMIKQGSYWMNDANTVKYQGHTLFNVHASQKLQGGWELWGQVRNLTNQRYSDSASSSYKGTGTYSPNTQNTYQLGAPRSVMVGLNKSFGT